MKNDKYLKTILTIIAICLIWICVRDVKIGGKEIYASESQYGRTEVEIVKVKPLAFSLAGPLEVIIVDSANPQDPKTNQK